MTTENVRWELKMLLETRRQLRLAGRDTDYSEDGRIKELRTFLDGQTPNEVTITGKKEALDEIPY